MIWRTTNFYDGLIEEIVFAVLIVYLYSYHRNIIFYFSLIKIVDWLSKSIKTFNLYLGKLYQRFPRIDKCSSFHQVFS